MYGQGNVPIVLGDFISVFGPAIAVQLAAASECLAKPL